MGSKRSGLKELDSICWFSMSTLWILSKHYIVFVLFQKNVGLTIINRNLWLAQSPPGIRANMSPQSPSSKWVLRITTGVILQVSDSLEWLSSETSQMTPTVSVQFENGILRQRSDHFQGIKPLADCIEYRASGFVSQCDEPCDQKLLWAWIIFTSQMFLERLSAAAES